MSDQAACCQGGSCACARDGTSTPQCQDPPCRSSPAVTVPPAKKKRRKPVPLSRRCQVCRTARAAVRRPKNGQRVCRECFYRCFEDEVHQTIVDNALFHPGQRVAIAASGGKDSTVLAHMMTLLNKRHGYGLDLFLLSIDEGITGYRDDSLETVKRNKAQYEIPLKIVSYEQLYGWTMDKIVKQIGMKNNCTFCGVFRRQALDRGAALMGAEAMVTGHNADDMAETVLMNILRGDVARLGRCVSIVTGAESALPRCKPFKYTYEKEIVMYAYFKKLDYFSTECIYSPNAYRGFAREFLKDLEAVRPAAILDVIHSAEHFRLAKATKQPTLGKCTRCGYIASNRLCKACVLLDALNRGKPRMALDNKAIRNVERFGSAVGGEAGAGTQTAQATAASHADRTRDADDHAAPVVAPSPSSG